LLFKTKAIFSKA